jgi:hypothetical protein
VVHADGLRLGTAGGREALLSATAPSCWTCHVKMAFRHYVTALATEADGTQTRVTSAVHECERCHSLTAQPERHVPLQPAAEGGATA